jgi:hypothetical protein
MKRKRRTKVRGDVEGTQERGEGRQGIRIIAWV